MVKEPVSFPQKLKAAEADGDHIYGVIKGSAVNHGRAASLTTPNPKQQAEVIKAAYKKRALIRKQSLISKRTAPEQNWEIPLKLTD